MLLSRTPWFSGIDTIPAFDRQTDGRAVGGTDGHTTVYKPTALA